MDQLLKQFNNDEHTREAVKMFLFVILEKIALERVYNREETKDLADAREIIETMFIELREKYADDKEKEKINLAR